MSTEPRDIADAPSLDDPTLDDRAYIEQVRAEIDEEVARRRAAGDLPPAFERELDELFLKYSPVAGRSDQLANILQSLDAAAYVDPVVPIDSTKPAGAFVKKALRSATYWYVGWVAHQVSQFASATSRAFHVVDEQLGELRHRLDAQRVPAVPVVEVPWAHRPDAWWVDVALAALGSPDRAEPRPGRVLHAASGAGWLVARLRAAGHDAYGVDPRPELAEEAAFEGPDLRGEPLLDHLRATATGSLAGIVLTGVVEASPNGEREQLVQLAAGRLAPGGVLVVHSLTPGAWAADDAPPAADIAAGRPYRAGTWEALLPFAGFEVGVQPGPDGRDYLVTARRSGDGA
jgi:SAM-dependent methyltransferase